MADPKKAGEQADAMIAEQNRLRAEAAAKAAAPAVEDQSAVADAIPAAGEPHQSDVKAPTPDASQVNREVELLKEQARIADQRWNVLQGMVNKKDSEIEQLRTLLAQVSQKQEAPAAAPAQPSSAVTAQDIEDFGQDLIDLITKISRSAATSIATQVGGKFESQYAEMKKSVDGIGASTAKTAADVFDADLTRRVPDWEQVNVDPAFLQWLQQVDDFTGEKRITLLNDAYGRMDLNRTAKFFEAYAKTIQPAAAPAAPAADPTKLLTPGKSKSSAPAPAQASAHVWTRADIAQLYEDNRLGRLPKEEFDRLERDLFKAQVENRLAA